MPILFRLAADLTVTLHMSYVLFVVCGQIAIIIGAIRKWQWIRNMWFRIIHISMITIVVFESLLGITCPLTTLERYFRRQAGQTTYQGDFVANCIHDAIFFEFQPWVFTAIYTSFGLLVVGTMVLAPPKRKRSGV